MSTQKSQPIADTQLYHGPCHTRTSPEAKGCTCAHINIPDDQVHCRLISSLKISPKLFICKGKYWNFIFGFMYDFFFIYFSWFLHLSFLYCYSFNLQAYFELYSSAIQFIISFSSSNPAWTTWKNHSWSSHPLIAQLPIRWYLQCFKILWPGSSTAATTCTDSPTQAETAAQKPSLVSFWIPASHHGLPVCWVPWPHQKLGQEMLWLKMKCSQNLTFGGQPVPAQDLIKTGSLQTAFGWSAPIDGKWWVAQLKTLLPIVHVFARKFWERTPQFYSCVSLEWP